jgi:hypothetical protein
MIFDYRPEVNYPCPTLSLRSRCRRDRTAVFVLPLGEKPPEPAHEEAPQAAVGLLLECRRALPDQARLRVRTAALEKPARRGTPGTIEWRRGSVATPCPHSWSSATSSCAE